MSLNMEQNILPAKIATLALQDDHQNVLNTNVPVQSNFSLSKLRHFIIAHYF